MYMYVCMYAAASGSEQNELQALGVSVYDQGTFEAGVMRQLDQEVSRRTAEQQRKFLAQEYSQLKIEKK